MSIDPVVRLAALHESDPALAESLLFAGCSEATSNERAITARFYDAITAFSDKIEDAIIRSQDELSLELGHAELLALALKSYRRGGRPRNSSSKLATHAATVALANSISSRKHKEGIPKSQADEQAAKEAARIGGQYGATVAWTTVLDRMKRSGKNTKRPGKNPRQF